MARALRAWTINRGGKNSVRNLRYGPRTQLVRGVSMTKIQEKSSVIRVSQGSSYRESTVFEKTHPKSIELVRVLEILEKQSSSTASNWKKMQIYPCIRLTRGKFELTNQDSASGKKFTVLTSM